MQTGWPAVTSTLSSTSHSARSAYSVFASSRVRTISSMGALASHAVERRHRGNHVLDAREHVVLERTGRRDDPVACGDALHRSAKIAPRRLLDTRGALGSKTAGQRPLLGRHE